MRQIAAKSVSHGLNDDRTFSLQSTCKIMPLPPTKKSHKLIPNIFLFPKMKIQLNLQDSKTMWRFKLHLKWFSTASWTGIPEMLRAEEDTLGLVHIVQKGSTVKGKKPTCNKGKANTVILPQSKYFSLTTWMYTYIHTFPKRKIKY